MHRIIPKIILLTSFICVQELITATGQQNDSILLNSPVYREKFQLFTDRSLFASGEYVMFRIFNLSHNLLLENNWSRVIYIELINSHNIPVVRGKYVLNNQGASGQILIPDTIATGSYYIRAYTRWMRNFSPSDYPSVPLSIVNPYKIDISGLKMPVQKENSSESNTRYDEVIGCTFNKSSYGKREKVILLLKEVNAGISPEGYCITVIKNGYLDTGYNFNINQAENEGIIHNGILYNPELKGFSISGEIINRQNRMPLANSRIYLTLLGSYPDCFEFKTDGEGKMDLSIPFHEGSHDILLTIDSKEQVDIQVKLDDEFSGQYAGFPAPTIDFFTDRKDLFEEMIVNSQIDKSFNPAKRDTLPLRESKANIPFYGTPYLRYPTDDYIALPNLEEFFFELIPSVRIIKEKNTRSMVVFGKYIDMSYYFPLILLDYVPVLDIETILSASPQRIEFVDIINTVYIRGNNYYGGVVNLVSKEGDRAGVKLPYNSSIINFTTFNDSKEFVYPDYENQPIQNKIPDLRSTLYWAPHVDFDTDSVKRIEFYTPDRGGEYSVIIQGVTKFGQLIRQISEFTVE